MTICTDQNLNIKPVSNHQDVTDTGRGSRGQYSGPVLPAAPQRSLTSGHRTTPSAGWEEFLVWIKKKEPILILLLTNFQDIHEVGGRSKIWSIKEAITSGHRVIPAVASQKQTILCSGF